MKYKLWVAKTKDKTVVRWTPCKSDISLSNMGSSTLDYHARGKKHIKKVKNRETDIGLFFQTCKSSTNTDSSSKRPATVKKKRNTLEDLIANENSLNAEIITIVILFYSFSTGRDIPLGRATTSSQGPRGCFHLTCLRLS